MFSHPRESRGTLHIILDVQGAPAFTYAGTSGSGYRLVTVDRILS
jgi:hypothetical protein